MLTLDWFGVAPSPKTAMIHRLTGGKPRNPTRVFAKATTQEHKPGFSESISADGHMGRPFASDWVSDAARGGTAPGIWWGMKFTTEPKGHSQVWFYHFWCTRDRWYVDAFFFFSCRHMKGRSHSLSASLQATRRKSNNSHTPVIYLEYRTRKHKPAHQTRDPAVRPIHP